MRTPPDNRRSHFIETVQWAGADWLAGIGLDHRGIAVEVWIDPGSEKVAVAPDFLAVAHEGAITASHLLQSGVRAAVHADRLSGSGLLAKVLRAAVTVEAEHGDEARRVHQLIEAAAHRDTVRADD
jgi:hypothetical protein